jgi:G6PDH family F420-dependent oxidoreductase
VEGLGTKAVKLAGRIADGYVCTGPSADLVRAYRDAGGRGPAQGGFKVCYAPSEEDAVRTAHRLWPIEQLPGELAQVLPTPRHFEQASTLVTPEMIAEAVPCGPDPARYAERVQSYVDAGFDEVYVQQIGADNGFFEFWSREVAPKVGV